MDKLGSRGRFTHISSDIDLDRMRMDSTDAFHIALKMGGKFIEIQ